jgi:hypothetical protein
MTRYMGIADCHGIESFTTEDKAGKGFLSIRVMCNRQRHAVYYEIELDESQVSAIQDLLKREMYERALEYIKATGKMCVPKEQAGSVELIPNSKLDPWRN